MISTLERQLAFLQKGPINIDTQQRVNNLVNAVHESRTRISSEIKTIGDGVKLVEVLSKIETLFYEYGGSKRILRKKFEEVQRIARRCFTLQSARSKNIQESFNNIRELRGISRNIYHQILAAWIAKQHFCIQKLGLPQREVELLGPHLTYLKMSGVDEPFIGEVLKRTRRLKQLVIKDCPLTGAAFSSFEKTGRLQRLVIERCAHFNHPLPQGMTALQTLKLFRCTEFDQKLPEGMSQLRILSMEHCPNYDQPLPADMVSLEQIRLRYVLKQVTELPEDLEYAMESDEEIENCLRKFPYLDFLVPIYLADRERALDLAVSLGAGELPVLKRVFEKIESQPQVDIQAMAQKIPHDQTKYLLYQIITHSEIRKLESYPQNMIVALFRTAAGREVIKESNLRYLEDVQLQKILFAAYPPNIPENLSLYPMKSDVRNDVLHLTIAPAMVRTDPDRLVDILLQMPINDFRITFYGSEVKEGEDREVQQLFLAELSQGIIHASKKYELKTTENGQVQLYTNENLWTFTGPIWEIARLALSQ